VANETGAAETSSVSSLPALLNWGWTDQRRGRQSAHRVINQTGSRTLLEGAIGEGENPVGETCLARPGIREYCGTREIPWEAGGTTLQG
jgi:hypothetical protein